MSVGALILERYALGLQRRALSDVTWMWPVVRLLLTRHIVPPVRNVQLGVVKINHG